MYNHVVYLNAFLWYRKYDKISRGGMLVGGID